MSATAAGVRGDRDRGGPRRRARCCAAGSPSASRLTVEVEGDARLRHRGRPRGGGRRRRASCAGASRTRDPGRGGIRRRRAGRATAGSSIRSTARRTSSTACRPSRCRSALEDEQAASSPARSTTRAAARPFTRVAAAGARLNGERDRVHRARPPRRRADRDRLPVPRDGAAPRLPRARSRRSSARRPACGARARRRSTSPTPPAGATTASSRSVSRRGTWPAGALVVLEAGGRRHRRPRRDRASSRAGIGRRGGAAASRRDARDHDGAL